MNKNEKIQEARKRLAETECDILSHIIVCDLDDIDNDVFVYNEEKLKKHIELLISLEDVLKDDEHISLEEAIFNFIINSGEVDYPTEEVIKDIVEHNIKNRKKIYINFKKVWRRELDLLSNTFEVRELARIEREIIKVNVDEIINSICDPSNFSTIPRRHTLLQEKKAIETELVKIGLKTLF